MREDKMLKVYIDSVFQVKYQFMGKWQYISEGCFFSHVGRLSPVGSDKMSLALRELETGTRPVERQTGAERERVLLSRRLYRHIVT